MKKKNTTKNIFKEKSLLKCKRNAELRIEIMN